MNKTLQTDTELFAAALTQRSVTVWLRDEPTVLPDAAGVIEKITPNYVRIRCNNGSKVHYLRSNVEFRF